MDTTNHTLDVIKEYGLKLLQPRDGYRFSADALLLASFADIPLGGRVIDLGCGCGIVSLLIAQRSKVKEIVGLELQPELADLAKENVSLNQMQSKVSIVCGDIRTIETQFTQHEFDALVANPPYWQVDVGRLNPDPSIAQARHEVAGNLQQLLAACAYLVRPRGRINLIYPVARLVEVLDKARRHQLQPKKLQFIHADAKTEANLFMLMLSPQAKAGLRVLPPKWLPGKAWN